MNDMKALEKAIDKTQQLSKNTVNNAQNKCNVHSKTKIKCVEQRGSH
ncbi:hypothetical protein Sarmat_00557 [Rickettsiales endosymbiont of Paramecium tredecaurelia]|nr:hypothetical protein [Candidatus Sarmatiella mevalonica]